MVPAMICFRRYPEKIMDPSKKEWKLVPRYQFRLGENKDSNLAIVTAIAY